MFKQVSFFRLNSGALPDLETLNEKLAAAEFKPVQGLDLFSEGFTNGFVLSPEFVFAADSTWGIALRKEERVLPSAVVKEILDERLADLEEREGRKIGKKEKQELKERIIDDLLPRAFTKSSVTQAVLDTKNGFLFVNSASENKASNLLSKLREALGGLEARLPQCNESAGELMTFWLMNSVSDGDFELGDECELRGRGDDVSVVKIAKEDLLRDEVVQHVKKGKVVKQLGLVWREQISFVLTEDFTLKKIKFLDTDEALGDLDSGDLIGFAQASQILMAESLSVLVSELASLMGGWKEL